MITNRTKTIPLTQNGRTWPYAIIGLILMMAVFNGSLIYYAIQAGAKDYYLKAANEDTK